MMDFYLPLMVLVLFVVLLTSYDFSLLQRMCRFSLRAFSFHKGRGNERDSNPFTKKSKVLGKTKYFSIFIFFDREFKKRKQFDGGHEQIEQQQYHEQNGNETEY